MTTVQVSFALLPFAERGYRGGGNIGPQQKKYVKSDSSNEIWTPDTWAQD